MDTARYADEPYPPPAPPVLLLFPGGEAGCNSLLEIMGDESKCLEVPRHCSLPPTPGPVSACSRILSNSFL